MLYKLNNNYINYSISVKKLDNINDNVINNIELINKSDDSSQSNYYNLLKMDDTMKFFNIFRKTFKLSKKQEIRNQNVIGEHVKDLRSRHISSKLEDPHYFFTARYNEKSKI